LYIAVAFMERCMRVIALVSLLFFSYIAAAQTYTESTIYNFGFSVGDGANPSGGLVIDKAGNLYGTTTYNAAAKGVSCCGAVYKLAPSGKETILHTFTGGTDGASPIAGLAIDKAGNLYGMTPSGGYKNQGTVFKITAAGKYSILHRFHGAPTDGAGPGGRVTLDSAGDVYGTTAVGGDSSKCNPVFLPSGCGTVFKLSSKGVQTILYSFTGYLDGAWPQANLIRDSAGNLYGTTMLAGANNDSGVIFKLSPSNVETVLYAFCALPDCADGQGPGYIVEGSDGSFYGTAGPGFNDSGLINGGVVFKVDPTGIESSLYTFCPGFTGGCPDGTDPSGPLLLWKGNIYGTSSVDFEITPMGEESVLSATGISSSGLVVDSAGDFYGTHTNNGNEYGDVFKLTRTR
jgi:uncharacterized repeat protein (TIGR03803 family)